MGIRTIGLVGSLLLTVTGCGAQSEPRQAEPSSVTTPSTTTSRSPTVSKSPDPAAPTKPTGTRIVVEDSDFGPMLFDSTGQAIYLFDVEATAEPRCYDDCEEAWPPVLAKGEPVPGAGTNPALLGTTKRTDGRLQVTYNDHPLYFYAHEGKREVLCHDVFLNGGNWYVVQPDGDAAPPG